MSISWNLCLLWMQLWLELNITQLPDNTTECNRFKISKKHTQTIPKSWRQKKTENANEGNELCPRKVKHWHTGYRFEVLFKTLAQERTIWTWNKNTRQIIMLCVILGHLLLFGNTGKLTTKMYNKRDDFFLTATFLFPLEFVPRVPRFDSRRDRWGFQMSYDPEAT